MKTQYLIITCLIIFFSSCSNNEENKQNQSLINKCDSLLAVNSQLNERVSLLSDSLSMLRYPASDRLIQIKKLVSEDKLDDAFSEISNLKKIFPLAKEIGDCEIQESIITTKKEKAKAEEERIKALGYKAFSDNQTITNGTKKFTLTGFNYGRTYTFDYCSDVNEYSYRTADKDNTYVLGSMSLTSTDKGYVSTPSIVIYEIVNGNLKQLDSFSSEYATWESYGAKIGNYSDDSHDFSKVNTIRYSIAAEISKSHMNKPLVILTSKDDNSLDESLSIEDVKKKCIVIKILNRNKL